MTAKPFTAPVCELLDPELHPPPRGVLLQVVTIGGVLVRSQWSDAWGIAWGPIPKIPETVKQRQREKLARLIAENEESK